jgi:hypothetical protein
MKFARKYRLLRRVAILSVLTCGLLVAVQEDTAFSQACISNLREFYAQPGCQGDVIGYISVDCSTTTTGGSTSSYWITYWGSCCGSPASCCENAGQVWYHC